MPAPLSAWHRSASTADRLETLDWLSGAETSATADRLETLDWLSGAETSATPTLLRGKVGALGLISRGRLKEGLPG